jgi:hypothetical protein
MILNGELEHGNMSESDYEQLIYSESKLYKPDVIVFEFCFNGLKKLGKYAEQFEDILIFEAVMLKQLQEERKKERRETFKIYKRSLIASVVTVATFVIVTGLAFPDFFRRFLNIPVKTPFDNNGSVIVFTDDTRIYDSMDKMIEEENLKILYPAELSDNYEFTNFRVYDYGSYLEVWAYSTDIFIDFIVEIGANRIVEYSHLQEINGEKYNVFERDGRYQAEWNYNEDYYSITVSDKAILTEIIKKLKES